MKTRWRVLVAAATVATTLVGCGPQSAWGQSSSPSAGGPGATPQAAKLDEARIAERLKRIMVPLIANMDRPIPLEQMKVGLIVDEHINAANGGGGDFVVTTGLLKKTDDDQLRTIMAHEVAHADLGHVAQHQALSTGIQLGIILLDELFPGSRALTPLAGQLFESAYSRSDEHEADAHGVTILRRAGYDGKKLMTGALAWLNTVEGGGGGFFATYPATGDRIQAVQRLP